MKKNGINFCPLTHTLSIIGGKWKILVLGQLVDNKTMRYKEIERAITPITPRVLIKVLKDLEEDELVSRKVFPEVPPRVEYSITELGKSLIPIVKEINVWGKYHQSKVVNKKRNRSAA
jgi:DNA-binding HxlR family transcriptional regulator